MGTLAGVKARAVGAGCVIVKHGRPLDGGPVLQGCCFGGAGVDGGEFFNGGARDADGGEVAAQATQPSVVAALLEGEGF